jgi:hypothetical protein
MNAIISEGVECKTVLINGQLLEVYTDGRVYRINKKGDLLIVENTANDGGNGYNQIGCNKKLIKRHRIIAFAFLELDIDNTKQLIDHRDGNKINNCLNNLRIVTNQQNQMNQTKAKGFCWVKQRQKFKGQICINNKKIFLGYFDTEDEARAAYQAAKLVHHQIN